MIYLLVNAIVHTMDDSLPVSQALAVKDGRIVEIGGTDEILWLREDDYELIDLEGQTVVPGTMDGVAGVYDSRDSGSRQARGIPRPFGGSPRGAAGQFQRSPGQGSLGGWGPNRRALSGFRVAFLHDSRRILVRP